MISNEIVLNKMMKEIQAAMQKADNHIAMLEHIENIQLLTDLFLEGNSVEKELQQDSTVSPVTVDQISKKPSVKQVPTNQDGTSIFDF